MPPSRLARQAIMILRGDPMAARALSFDQLLDATEKLPAEDQAAFSSWKKIAQDRFLLETTQKTLLLEIAGG